MGIVVFMRLSPENAWTYGLSAQLPAQNDSLRERAKVLAVRDSAGADFFTVFGNGNVLTEGTIFTKKVDVSLSPSTRAPDYVFAPDYRLRDLAEVEAYVKANRHLPGIPAEAEMRAEGLDLAEMNLRLLEKVEELTLYAIEQEKRLRKLEAQLNAAQAETTENQK